MTVTQGCASQLYTSSLNGATHQDVEACYKLKKDREPLFKTNKRLVVRTLVLSP